MKGIRGLCDRKHVVIPEDYIPVRRLPQFGDFELSSFIVEDMLISIHNPNFRPYTLSIINANLPLFRRQWFLYDWICANSIVGSVDDCLFSVHKPQTKDLEAQKDLSMNWSKLSNLKLYGLPVDHIQNGYGLQGPLSWITKGTIDLDMHFLAPHTHYDEDLFDKILEQVDGLKDVALDKFEAVMIPKDKSKSPSPATSSKRPSLKEMRHYRMKGAHGTTSRQSLSSNNITSEESSPLSVSTSMTTSEDDFLKVQSNRNSGIVMLGRLKIKDLKANVPIADESLGYMSSALIRPVVGWMNANRTLIPLSLSAQVDLVSF
jgi:distribution and morphology protein 31